MQQRISTFASNSFPLSLNEHRFSRGKRNTFTQRSNRPQSTQKGLSFNRSIRTCSVFQRSCIVPAFFLDANLFGNWQMRYRKQTVSRRQRKNPFGKFSDDAKLVGTLSLSRCTQLIKWYIINFDIIANLLHSEFNLWEMSTHLMIYSMKAQAEIRHEFCHLKGLAEANIFSDISAHKYRETEVSMWKFQVIAVVLIRNIAGRRIFDTEWCAALNTYFRLVGSIVANFSVYGSSPFVTSPVQSKFGKHFYQQMQSIISKSAIIIMRIHDNRSTSSWRWNTFRLWIIPSGFAWMLYVTRCPCCVRGERCQILVQQAVYERFSATRDCLFI